MVFKRWQRSSQHRQQPEKEPSAGTWGRQSGH